MPVGICPVNRTANQAMTYTKKAAMTTNVSTTYCGITMKILKKTVTRFRPSVPILAYSPNERVVRQLGLSWGTWAGLSEERPSSVDAIADALASAKRDHGLFSGDQVVVISGQSTEARRTDTLQLLTIP